MPINRILKDKRAPEEIELLNKAFNHALNLLGVVDRNDPLCDIVARKVIEVGASASASRERSRKWPWPLAYGKGASVGGPSPLFSIHRKPRSVLFRRAGWTTPSRHFSLLKPLVEPDARSRALGGMDEKDLEARNRTGPCRGDPKHGDADRVRLRDVSRKHSACSFVPLYVKGSAVILELWHVKKRRRDVY